MTMTGIERGQAWLAAPTSALPLLVFRVAFGLTLFASTLRFVSRGWIEELYLAPSFHFSYYGFAWVKPLPGAWLYLVFAGMALGALGIAAGRWYRLSVAGFFVLFTYIELLDKAYYLNHYYFVSLLSFLLLFLPLSNSSVTKQATVPRWVVLALRMQVGLVYFWAGVAKLKADWLLHALPLRLWLPAHTDFPLIGPLFDYGWVALGMSWAGAFFDLTVPFFLSRRRTRPVAYLVSLVFHTITGYLFPIGVFPWVMSACALVFFTREDYAWLSQRIGRALSVPLSSCHTLPIGGGRALLLGGFFALQMLLPLRHWLYPGDVLWTEEGFRFAWNVMLVEKSGNVTFHLYEPATGRRWLVYPGATLTRQQEKQMAFQPDMILEFAHHLEREWRKKGGSEVEIRAEAHVSLNGRPSRLLLDPTADLTRTPLSLAPKPWILERLEQRGWLEVRCLCQTWCQP